jgi:hypothetical protein
LLVSLKQFLTIGFETSKREITKRDEDYKELSKQNANTVIGRLLNDLYAYR